MSISPILEIVSPYLQGRLKGSGPKNIMARCPFHEDNKPSFAINIENGLWICHACGLSGGLVDFLVYAGMSREKIDALLGPVREDLQRFKQKQEDAWKWRFVTSNIFLRPLIHGHPIPETLLGAFDWMPTYLVKDGFDKNLLRSIGVGFDRQKKRITFPIRDLYGNLAGVSGRTVINGEIPRYKVYRGGYITNGIRIEGDFGTAFDLEFPNFETDKSHYLWNAHRVWAQQTHSSQKDKVPLIIVEGFKACIWLLQQSIKNVVALMGSSMSYIQQDLIIRLADEVILFLDRDEAGLNATAKLGWRLRQKVIVSVCQEYKAQQPDELTKEQIDSALCRRERYDTWLRRVRPTLTTGTRDSLRTGSRRSESGWQTKEGEEGDRPSREIT